MIEKHNQDTNLQELSEQELETVVGVYSAGGLVVYKEYTKCPTCLMSIPSAKLLFYRGLDPNSERDWIVKTGCCNTTFHCVESAIQPL